MKVTKMKKSKTQKERIGNKMNTISVEHSVKVLNSAVRCDKEAIQKLIEERQPCNEKLAEHPTIQVLGEEGKAKVGLLGIINGLFGTGNDGRGYVVAAYDDDGKLMGFKVTK